MNALQRRGRLAAIVGGVVAAGATTVLVLVGTASAAEQGRCTDNVNVRSQPSATASVVTVCKRGTDVTLGEHRNGFVQLTNLNGWASEQYVSTNPGRSSSASTTKKSSSAPTTSGAARGEQARPTTAAPATTKSAEHRGTPASSTTTTKAPTSTAAPTTTTQAPTSSSSQSAGDQGSDDATPARAPGLLG